MGNAASTERGGGKRPNEKLIVKPPTDWTANTEAQKFIVVSPQSDISNPSQIRLGRGSKAGTMTSKTPMRKRASKVVSKVGGPPALQHNMVTGLPEPESFYFDPASAADPPVLVTDSQDQILNEDGKKKLHDVMRAKATRAKRLLKGCWKEQKETFEGCVREKQVEHERFKSMSPQKFKRTSASTKHDYSFGRAKGPQFIPDIEEEELELNNTMSPRQVYLHDEESYMKRIQAPSLVNDTPLMKRDEQFGVDVYGTCSSIGGDSPVAKLFERRAHSDSGLPQESQTYDSDTAKRASCPETIDNTPIPTDQKYRKPNTVERDIQKQVDEQLSLKFESKSEQIGRVKRLRESYLQRLESTRRLSQEEESRRQSIESKLELLREKVIAEEFQEYDIREVVKENKEPDSPFDEPKEEKPPKPFDEMERPVFRGRASEPVPRSTNGVNVAKPVRKSEPSILSNKIHATSNESTGLPVLLKIAGWENATKKSAFNKTAQQKPQQEMPAVLQLAGWKQPQQMRRSSLAAIVNKSQSASSDSQNKVDAQKEERAMNQAASEEEDASQDENFIPMPYGLQTKAIESPKETPVVQKLGRMLLQTHTFASEPEPPKQYNQYGALVPATNLNDSMDSDATPFNEISRTPMVAQDALINAAFLFSPSYVNNDASLLRMGDAKSESTTTITTLDSRNRLLPSYASTISSKRDMAETIEESSSTSRHSSSGMYTASETSSEKQSSSGMQSLFKSNPSVVSRSTDSADRQVRFSIGNKVIVSSAKKLTRKSGESFAQKSPLRTQSLEVPKIENKLSDLTDIFSTGRASLVSLDSRSTIPIAKESIDKIPETTDDDTPTSREIKSNSLEPSPPSNWSYSFDMDNGVTPLRSGKGNVHTNATNSPHKRFNEAKNRFSMGKTSPVKKRSPIKPRASKSRQSGGFVHARVAAMESKSKTSNSASIKVRRDTIGHKAIAPRKTVLKSQHFKTNFSGENTKRTHPQDARKSEKSNEQKTSKMTAAQSNQPTPVQLTVAQTTNTRFAKMSNSSAPLYACNPKVQAQPQVVEDDDDDSDSDSDVFGTLRQSSTADEADMEEADSLLKNLVSAHHRTANLSHASASTEVEDDDFAALLQYQTSIDEGDESAGEETVTTIQRPRMSVGSSTVMSGSTAPTIVRRSSVGERSIMSVGTVPTVVRRSSVVSGSSVPTVVQKEVPEVQRSSYPPRRNLPFRDVAPVRPTEQSHRAVPGTLVLSPMQRTPMQAMKWRALAAAEKEKTDRLRGTGRSQRKSLSERNPNIVGNF